MLLVVAQREVVAEAEVEAQREELVRYLTFLISWMVEATMGSSLSAICVTKVPRRG